ncbi:MAG: holo-ACP synthase [Clostridia bacterium]|nr:holo-ACP synthase [Clostridia bacterium]
MNVKMGIDSVEISRIEDALKTAGFAKRVFSEREREYFEAHGMKPQSIAGAWCAKEAFSKAMGQGVSGFSLAEVEVLHDELGKPYYSLLGAAAELAEKKGVISLDLSITHDRTKAFAVAVCLTED